MWRAALILSAIFFFVGCGTTDSSTERLAFTSADPWFRAPPNEFIGAGFTEIPNGDFGQVTFSEDDALKRLTDSPFVELTARDAASYLGRPLEGKDGHLILLRAVVLNEGTEGYWVTWLNGMVRVHHASLGKHPVPMKRRAIVARLPAVPTEVYVDCSMAE